MTLAISAALALSLDPASAHAQLFDPSMSLASLDGRNGFVVNATEEFTGSGKSVSNAGDINGDGIDDLLIGAPFSGINGYNTGSTYVVFGKTGAHASTLLLSEIDGSNGFRMDGARQTDQSGWSVSAAGDINGDGIDDLVLGAPYTNHNGGYSGSAYVVFGKSGGFAPSFSLATLDGINGFRMDGVSHDDQTGDSVSNAGDINGDGIDDLIIGAFYANSTTNVSGAAYVVFGSGSAFRPAMQLSALNGSNGFRIEGEDSSGEFGLSVSSAGDVNGDGIGDLIIGAPRANGDSIDTGKSYLIFGRSSGFDASFLLSALDGDNGVRLIGASYRDESGRSVSSAGDINADGIDDVIVGAWKADNSDDTAGSAYVVFGSKVFPSSDFLLSSLDGSNGFRLDGVARSDYAGEIVSGAGDVNGDGVDDLLISAAHANPGSQNAGSVYVYFGSGTAFPPVVSLADLDGFIGMRFDGIAENDGAGHSASGAGDVNNDGVDDLIIGASGTDIAGPASGSSYVVFGRRDRIFESGFE
ncbi:integrin alpha [Dokdonella sp.]|uniref:integrin alpha n=1 Tax=Dokdonella sp. TaxID=2291710 RepID=UPI003C49ED35